MISFSERLLGSVIVADGAMGTVLHAAGNPLDRALPELNLSNPALVRTVHESYLDAGAEIIQTNTFAADALRLGGPPALVRQVNAAGVRVAREAAAGRAVFVVGSVSPAVTMQQRRRVPSAQRRQALREQVEVLAGEGVDLLVLETFGHLDELVEAVDLALATGVPVLAQATFATDGRMLSGDSAADLCRALDGRPLAALGTNCTLGPQGVLAVVEQLRAGTALPLVAQPNAGLPRRTGPRFTYDVETDYFARYARLLADAGAAVVGGCCGTTPAHIRAAADAVRDRPEPAPQREIVLRRRIVGAEIEAPPAGRLAAALTTAEQARDRGATLLCVAAGATARAHLSPVTVAVHLQNRLGVDTLACVPTWDKTIMALQADLLGAHALGVRRVVCETGRPPLLGDYPHVDGVWDVDSVGLVALLAGLNAGTDFHGLHLAGRTSFDIGARINPGALDAEEELARARRKLDAGAGFVLTRPVYELDRLRALLDGLGSGESGSQESGDHAPKVLVCVRPLRSFDEAEYLRHEVPDVFVPTATLAALRRAGDAAPAVGTELAAELVRGAGEIAAGVVIVVGEGDTEPLFAAAREP